MEPPEIYFTNTIAPQPSQIKHAKAAVWEAGQVAKKLRNSSLTQNYGAEEFPNNLYVSGDKLLCEFRRHAVDWECVDTCKDHLGSEAHVKSKKNTELHTLSNGKISLEG